jgi:hypothetical protein
MAHRLQIVAAIMQTIEMASLTNVVGGQSVDRMNLAGQRQGVANLTSCLSDASVRARAAGEALDTKVDSGKLSARDGYEQGRVADKQLRFDVMSCLYTFPVQ